MSATSAHCPHCQETFRDRIKLNFHLLNSASSNDPCVVCKVDIPTCVTRKHHIDSHPMCQHCKIHFKDEENMHLHKIVYHSDTVPENLFLKTAHGWCICYLCDLLFDDAELVNIHIKASHFVIKNTLQHLK